MSKTILITGATDGIGRVTAMEFTGLDTRTGLAVADIGCGTGASTRVLAEALDAHITAVDLFPEFLDELMCRATARGIDHRVTPLAAPPQTRGGVLLALSEITWLRTDPPEALAQHPGPETHDLVDAVRAEIALYERHSAFVSYGLHVARHAD